MSNRWDGTSWTKERQNLCRAVYEATAKEARYAPMDNPLYSGKILTRTFDRKYLKMPAPDKIDSSSALDAIRVRDAATDANRFTGIVPGWLGAPRIELTRGGLYCSQENTSLMAEMYHYSGKAPAKSPASEDIRHGVAFPKCFATLRVVKSLDVANLDSQSNATLSFLDRIQKNDKVFSALKACRYKELFDALYNDEDYSAARGLGLGLASNPEIHGAQVLSARDYVSTSGGNEVYQTGDNVILFGQNNNAAVDLVQVTALCVVDSAGPGSLAITRFTPGGSGLFEASGTETI